MYYGILGDSNGDDPEVTGEASWLMARTCFPDDDLNGAEGHAEADVTCKPYTRWPETFPSNIETDIVFTGDDAVLPSSALNKNYITNFSTLRSMGDKLVGALASNLGLSGSSPSPSASVPSQTTLATSAATSAASTSSASGSTATCSWEGHCEGTWTLRSIRIQWLILICCRRYLFH